jgi:type VI secretion system protein VasJ
MRIDVNERSELGRIPIPGDNPAGEPLSGDEQFDKLRAEVSRDPILGVPIDWKVVADLSQELLATRSKDIAVACYLSVGLLHTEQLIGLRDGLQILSDLFRNFWDSAYPQIPKRLRGRVNAIGFLSEKGAPVLADIDPTLGDADCLSECNRLFDEIDTFARERCDGHEVPLGDLARALREFSSRMPVPAESPAALDPNLSAASAATVGSAAPASGLPLRTEFSSKSDIESLLFRVATFLKENDSQDPLGYRLPRIVDFSDLTSAPPETEGKLLIPGPAESQLSSMRSLWSASNWLGLAETADNVCRANPLSLDAHRYCSEALAALGGPYRAAADGIRDEVRSLVKRVPKLVRMQFADGMPLADAETQQWLQDESLAPTATVASEIDPEVLETARAEARELGKKGDLPSALAHLESAVSTDSSQRGRFLGRLELAELCVSTGHDRVALPMLAELDDTLIKHGLEAWEPSLSRRLLELYYQCRKRRAGDDTQVEEANARAEKLYERLCRVDPIAAAALE